MLETRLIVAYSLLAAMAVGAVVSSVVWGRRHAARKRRLRGIKTENTGGSRR